MTARNFCEQCGAALPAPGGDCPRCLMELGERPVAPAAHAAYSGPPPPEPAEIAAEFPSLEVLEVVGRGGMGVVYRARQRGLGREVALKILPPECSADPTFAERFEREARVLARLDHPNIVRVHDAGKTGDRYWLTMEFIDGLNLRRLVTERSVPPRESLAIVTQICDALQYAHDAGVVHRDIKPENILVDRRGKVKIADFGLAKLLSQEVGGVTLTRSDQAMGTVHYMAPEQIRHPLEVDHRADIYSLGVVFYELLTGELPVGNFPLPSDQEGVDSRLDEVVLKSLEREPERRYQGAGDVRTDVQRASEPAASSASSSCCGEPRRSTRRRGETRTPGSRRRKISCAVAGGGCLLLAIVGLGLLLVPYFFLRASQSVALVEVEQAREEAMRAQRGALIEAVARRYAEIEADHTEDWERLEDGGLRVQIGPFPEEWQTLHQELRDILVQYDGPTFSETELEGLTGEFLPYGRTYSVVEIHPTGAGWSWTDTADWSPEEPERLPLKVGPQLPRSLRRYLRQAAEREAESRSEARADVPQEYVAFGRAYFEIGEVFHVEQETEETEQQLVASAGSGGDHERNSSESKVVRKRVEVLNAERWRITEARVTYEAFQTTTGWAEDPMPAMARLGGKTLWFSLDEEGEPVVRGADGEELPEELRQAALRDNRHFDRRGSHAELLPSGEDGSFRWGVPFDVSGEALIGSIGLHQKGNTELEVSEAAMTAVALREIAGERAAIFEVRFELELREGSKPVARIDLAGELALAVSTSRPLSLELHGPVTVLGDAAVPTLGGEGELRLRQTFAYDDRER